MRYIFETEMEVRDYECDIQGIVNNANYLHYAEHTRHLFLSSLGVSFSKLHEQGTDAVVARMNLQYKTPLRCDDVFISRLALRKEGLATSSARTYSAKATDACASAPRWNWCASSTDASETATTTTAPSRRTYEP